MGGDILKLKLAHVAPIAISVDCAGQESVRVQTAFFFPPFLEDHKFLPPTNIIPTMSSETNIIAQENSTEPVNKNKRYRKPKPWDTDDIDHVRFPTSLSSWNSVR